MSLLEWSPDLFLDVRAEPRNQGVERLRGVREKLTLIQAIVPSADQVVTQGDVHEEIDLLCYLMSHLNVEDLKISMLLVSTRRTLVSTSLCFVAYLALLQMLSNTVMT